MSNIDYGPAFAPPLSQIGKVGVTGQPSAGQGLSLDEFGNIPASVGWLPTGMIMLDAGSTAPTGWLACDGAAISREEYAELFSRIGTTYGTGDGSTTFNLPNLKGKVPVGIDAGDASFDVLGETGGEKTHTLTEAELASHRHSFAALSSGGGAQRGVHNDNWDNVTTFASLATGGDAPHNNLQPYVVLNYIIKV